MSKKNKKLFFANHAKSSAALVSLAVHAVIILVALFSVAVTVIQRDEVNFTAAEVKRPKMNLRKLQVPVKQPVQQPKLRKQIVVKPNVAIVAPDIKLPEIIGVKGGLGAGGGGFGSEVSLGFSMPEINLFGVKGKGEKVFIILNSSSHMMHDELGGIPAFTIIKEELIRIIDSLPPTALFNLAVFDEEQLQLLFPNMVSANAINQGKVRQWLTPLNAVRTGMGDSDYGLKTLGFKGVVRNDEIKAGRFDVKEFVWMNNWYHPSMISMEQQADTIFLLTRDWGNIRYDYDIDEEKVKAWYASSAGKKWQECYQKGKKMLAEENKERAAKGQAPRVLADHPWHIVPAYFPGVPGPPTEGSTYFFTPEDFMEAFILLREKNKPSVTALQSGRAKKKSSKKEDFSFNVIQFVKEGESADANSLQNFKRLTSLAGGEYKTVAGMSAIESYIGAQKTK